MVTDAPHGLVKAASAIRAACSRVRNDPPATKSPAVRRPLLSFRVGFPVRGRVGRFWKHSVWLGSLDRPAAGRTAAAADRQRAPGIERLALLPSGRLALFPLHAAIPGYTGGAARGSFPHELCTVCTGAGEQPSPGGPDRRVRSVPDRQSARGPETAVYRLRGRGRRRLVRDRLVHNGREALKRSPPPGSAAGRTSTSSATASCLGRAAPFGAEAGRW